MKTTVTLTGAAVGAVLMICINGSFAVQNPSQEKGAYPSLIAASEVKGSKVKNIQSEEIGYIEDVLLDPDTGDVRFAVLNVGGFLGIGGTKVAVPWNAFQISKEGNKPKYILDATKDRLEKAPKIEGSHYERLYTRRDAEPIFVYWHVTWVEPSAEASPSNSP
jgi:sporulation protein YlmC with PRC-barrel domain